MIVCTKCGYENEDSDAFCGSCAGFLEWSGQRVVEETPPAPEAPPEPEPEARPGLVERVKDAIGVGDDRGAAPAPPVTAPPAEGAPLSPPLPLSDPGDGVPRHAAPAPPPMTAAPAPTGFNPTAPNAPAPAQSLGAPVPTQPAAAQPPTAQPAPMQPVATQAAPRQPEAVKPAAVATRPAHRTKVSPSRTINPGDLICGQCGEGNDPTRKFCRRCGNSLLQAETFKVPWYRRLLPHRRVRTAGDRPKTRRRAVGGGSKGWLTSWVTKVVLLVVVVLVVLVFVGPFRGTFRNHLSRYYHDAANVVHPTYDPINAESATASASATGHPPGLAIDDLTNTSWQTTGPASGVGQSLTLQLAASTDIAKMGFLNGDQDTSSSFLKQPRPKMIRVAFNGASPSSTTLTLADEASFQTFSVTGKSVSSLTITILSVYPSTQGTQAAVAEVELYKES